MDETDLDKLKSVCESALSIFEPLTLVEAIRVAGAYAVLLHGPTSCLMTVVAEDEQGNIQTPAMSTSTARQDRTRPHQTSHMNPIVGLALKETSAAVTASGLSPGQSWFLLSGLVADDVDNVVVRSSVDERTSIPSSDGQVFSAIRVPIGIRPVSVVFMANGEAAQAL